MRARWLIVGIAVAAATAFAISVQGGRWWVVAGFDVVEIGPSGSYRCFGGECRSTGLGWIAGSNERWMRTGTGAWAAGLLSMLMLLVVAGAAAARRAPRLAVKATLVSIGTAAVTGGLFVLQFPGVQGAEVTRGIPLFGAAIVLGAAACIAVLRVVPPTREDEREGAR